MAKRKIEVLRDEIQKARRSSYDHLQQLLANDASAVAALLASEPAALAELLARAAQDLAGGGMNAAESTEIADALSRQPVLLSRLLSGMGA